MTPSGSHKLLEFTDVKESSNSQNMIFRNNMRAFPTFTILRERKAIRLPVTLRCTTRLLIIMLAFERLKKYRWRNLDSLNIK